MSELSEVLRTNCGFFEVEGYMSVRTGCCSGTKNGHAITVYIPVEWCNAFGHDINIIKEWLDVVQEALGHRKIELVENLEGEYIHEFPKSHVEYAVCKSGSFPSGTDSIAGSHSNIINNEFYKLIIPEGTRYQNYFTFVLLRHLYSDHYIPIVTKALEIRKQLTITDNKSLSAILMAYLEKDYAGYYGVCDPSIKWRYKYVNPEFNKDTTRLNTGFMNNYDYFNHTKYIQHSSAQIGKFKTLLEAQDWGGLEKILYVEELKRFPAMDAVREPEVETAKDSFVIVEQTPVTFANNNIISSSIKIPTEILADDNFLADDVVIAGSVTKQDAMDSIPEQNRGSWSMFGENISVSSVVLDMAETSAVQERVANAETAILPKKKKLLKKKIKKVDIIVGEVPKKKLKKKKKVIEGEVIPVKKKVKKLKRKTVI